MSHKIEINEDRLWPTSIWRTNLQQFKKEERKVSVNEDIINWIISEQKKNPKSDRKSNYGGWQSRTDVFKDPIMQDLCKEIWVVVKNLFPMVEGVRFEQMWAVINKRGDWNIIHQHGRYEISGGYYLQVSPNCGKIAFRDPRSAAPGNYFLNHFKDKGDVIWYTPKECDLMLWPSFLDHFVEPSQSDNDRIMISFDMMVNHSS